MEPVSFEDLSSQAKAEDSASIRKRIQTVRSIQYERFRDTGIYNNAVIPPGKIQEYCPLTYEASVMLQAVFDKLELSARAYDKILKVARTIVDMSGKDTIQKEHIAAAVQFRSLDRKYWSSTG